MSVIQPAVPLCLMFLTTALLLSCGFSVTEGLKHCDPGPCGPGQYWDGTECLNCPEDTFMDNDQHRCQSCVPCTQQKPDFVKLQECTSSANSKYKCPPGSVQYSHNDYDGPECKPCRECPAGYRTVSECMGDKDTACQLQSQTEETTHQSTKTSTEKESQSNHEPHWTHTSTQPNNYVAWSTNSTHSNGTPSNSPTCDGSMAIVSMVVPTIVLVCLFIALVVGYFVWRGCRHKKTNKTKQDHHLDLLGFVPVETDA
ncbi:unnamed protein product [Candidula unifasciata]|uniref:TNFR-Cys domain-containing protein n=1 Tax=Candidula unifasciata TaxID=100452 RepID=A0A8S4A8N7_9EUPU|nr:unnamed protein product [Candidula unifasciata]